VDRPLGMLRSLTHGVDAPRSIKKGTIPRIWRFAAPYRRGLSAFLLFTVVSSVVGVITPILAGRVVDTIVARGDAAVASATVIGLVTVTALIGLGGLGQQFTYFGKFPRQGVYDTLTSGTAADGSAWVEAKGTTPGGLTLGQLELQMAALKANQ